MSENRNFPSTHRDNCDNIITCRSASCCDKISEKTTIHGLKYILNSRRPWGERCIWTFIFSLFFGICCFLVREIYQEWYSSPFIFTFDNKMTRVGDIPFPTVTICPEEVIQDRDGNILLLRDKFHLKYIILSIFLQPNIDKKLFSEYKNNITGALVHTSTTQTRT